MSNKFPKFKYVSELADYLWRQIEVDESNDHYLTPDTPAEVRQIWEKMRGLRSEKYESLCELSEAVADPDGIETYLNEIEAPIYNSDLLKWMIEDPSDTRIYEVDQMLKETGGEAGLMRCIQDAWIKARQEELQEVVDLLEEYLDV